MITLVISGAALASGAYMLQHYQRMSDYKAYAAQLTRVNNGVQTLVSEQYAAYVAGTPIAGFADPLHPTIAELRTAKKLPSGFPDKGIFGGNFQVEIALFPPACVPPNCDVTTKVYGSQPVFKRGTSNVDESGAAIVARELGADGANSKSTSSDRFFGRNGSDWGAASNPSGLAGVVAVRGGYGSAGWGQFLRADGSTPQTGTQKGDWKIQNNLTAGGNATITGDATAGRMFAGYLQSSGNVVAGGNIQATGDVTGNGLIGNSVFSNGAVTALGAVSGAQVNSSGDVTASGKLVGNEAYANYIQSNGNLVATGGLAIGGGGMFGGNVAAGSVTSAADVVAGGNIATATGTVSGKKLQAAARIVAGEFVQINGMAAMGSACPQPGLIGTDAGTGAVLACVGGNWASASASGTGNLPTYTNVTSVLNGVTKTYTSHNCPSTSTCSETMTVGISGGVVTFNWVSTNCIIVTGGGPAMCSTSHTGTVSTASPGAITWGSEGVASAGGFCSFSPTGGASCMISTVGSNSSGSSVVFCTVGLSFSLDYLASTPGAPVIETRDCGGY